MRELEIWKDIRGYTGLYQISSWGRVWSVPRRAANGYGVRKVGGRILRESKHVKGYMLVELNKSGTGTVKTVHRLVAKAFHKNPKRRKYINHLDGDKANNYYKNVAWCSATENMLHAYDTGLR